MIESEAQIRDMITQYEKAETAALANSSYTINGRTLSRSNLTEIRNGRREWERRLMEFRIARNGGNPMASYADFTS